ncbi:hypothetical protein [Aliivibrio fischeri]|nr:hypothetical protein [Aliivibrio fischeri]
MSLENFLIKMTDAFVKNHGSYPVKSQIEGWQEVYKTLSNQ